MSRELKQTLKKAGLKTTPIRKLILDAFSADCKPINAGYIYGKLKGKDINQVTIYRTLASFEKAGILKKVELQKGASYYELSGNHHHHVVCVECGKTEGFENCSMNDISKEVLKTSLSFKTIDQHSLELFGMCRSCSRG